MAIASRHHHIIKSRKVPVPNLSSCVTISSASIKVPQVPPTIVLSSRESSQDHVIDLEDVPVKDEPVSEYGSTITISDLSIESISSSPYVSPPPSLAGKRKRQGSSVKGGSPAKCPKCSKGQCKIHEDPTLISNGKLPYRSLPKDWWLQTLPKGLSVQQCGAEEGVLGVVALKAFPPRSLFGPYRGRILLQNLFSRKQWAGWKLSFPQGTSLWVDAKDSLEANWMRLVRTTRVKGDFNLTAVQREGQIFFQANRLIEAGEELLVKADDSIFAEAILPADIFTETMEVKKEDDTQMPTDSGEANGVQTRDQHGRKDGDTSSFFFLSGPHAAVPHSQTGTRNRARQNHISAKTIFSLEDLEGWATACSPAEFFRALTDGHPLKLPHHLHDGDGVPVFGARDPDRNGYEYLLWRVTIQNKSTRLKSWVKEAVEIPISTNSQGQGADEVRAEECTEEGDADVFHLEELVKIEQVSTQELEERSDGQRKVVRGPPVKKEKIEERRIKEEEDKKKKKFMCHVCDKLFGTSSDLKVHSRRHTGEKPFQCDTCGASFASANSFRRHERTHTKNWVYSPCSVCGKIYRKDLLRRHELTHDKDKPHCCPECGKSFLFAYELRAHQRMHTDERPFQCPVCVKTFRTKYCMLRHKNLHGEPQFQCPCCDKKFYVLYSMTKHQKRCSSGSSQSPNSRGTRWP